MERKSKVEIINDLLKYNLGNRSTKPRTPQQIKKQPGVTENCVYNGSNGTHCAFGQYLRPEYQIGEPYFGNNSSLTDVLNSVKSLDKVLRDEVHGHNYEFWSDMQAFHDNVTYFTQTGLSRFGQEKHQKLLIKWELATFEDEKSD